MTRRMGLTVLGKQQCIFHATGATEQICDGNSEAFFSNWSSRTYRSSKDFASQRTYKQTHQDANYSTLVQQHSSVFFQGLEFTGDTTCSKLQTPVMQSLSKMPLFKCSQHCRRQPFQIVTGPQLFSRLHYFEEDSHRLFDLLPHYELREGILGRHSEVCYQ